MQPKDIQNNYAQVQAGQSQGIAGSVVTGQYQPHHARPCPTCGTCPTCGAKGWPTQGYPYVTYTSELK